MSGFSADFTALMSALKTLKKAQAARAAIPILHHVAVVPNALGEAVLTVTDLDVFLSLTLPGSLCDESFTVSRADLEKALTGGDKTQRVWIDAQDVDTRPGTATLKHDDLTIELETLPIGDFPERPVAGESINLDLSAKAGREILTFCAGAMSTEETRYYLRGVYLHQMGGDSGRLGAVATDGHRLNLAETPKPYAGRGVIISDATVKLALSLMGKDDLDGYRVRLPQTDGHRGVVVISGTNWELVSREVDGSFPDYTRVVPSRLSAKGKATLPCKVVGDAARRVARITSKRGAAILDAERGCLRHNGFEGVKGLNLALKGVWTDGEVQPVGVSSVYLGEAMVQMGAFGESCRAYVNDSDHPLRLEATAPSWAESVVSVVMPMRF